MKHYYAAPRFVIKTGGTALSIFPANIIHGYEPLSHGATATSDGPTMTSRNGELHPCVGPFHSKLGRDKWIEAQNPICEIHAEAMTKIIISQKLTF